MNVTVFVDLEETLVDNWSDGNFLEAGARRVRNLLETLRVDFGTNNVRLGLMSWAVWDEKDKANFNARFRAVLENELQHSFDERFVWSMDDWATEVFKHHKKKVSRQDLFDMFGKEEVLFVLARCHPEFSGNVFLVDDAVSHELQVSCPQNNSFVEILNVKKMQD